MRRSLFAILALFSVGVACAQAPTIYPIVADSPATTPRTTIKVCLTVERDAVRTGPYARYAQKYLGVIAPLTDRVDYSLLSARLDYAAPGHQSASVDAPSVVRDNEFGRVSIDRTSVGDKSTEEMAREAANTIFRLRKQRLDILTGDVGELYPSGLGEALAEITRMENEYLELFLGKHTFSTEVREYDISPVKGKAEYAVCRFPDAGGEQVVLAITAEGSARDVAPVKGDKRKMTQYRVADFASCTLRMGARELATARMPVYQFGVTITAPVQ